MSNKLTYEQMREVIDRGESVLYGGRVLTMVEQLPTPYELAGNDSQAQADALAEMKASIARQQAQLEALAGVDSVDDGFNDDLTAARKQTQRDNMAKARAARAARNTQSDALAPVPSEEAQDASVDKGDAGVTEDKP